ncbi:MAG: tRNA lysidine(34) synthetase TilS [Muribaculaceae bacterium]|nr:tRNA lysidine(34) synthetase TilS [Muribaculaceae bacterium]
MSNSTPDAFELSTARFIDSKALLHRKAPMIVALSGGADSVALLAALVRLGYDCRAAHCNFHLRGEESMRDMRHCQELCERLDVDLYVRDFDVAARMSEHPSESVEMACRELRYSWFADLLDREGAQALATGHHRNDRAETFILNLMRGAGIAGLTSLNARHGSVVRPLLWASRAEIEAYLAARGLPFITDSSNSSDVHRRNRIRNRVLPLLEECFPGATDAILRSVANLESARSIFNEAVEERRHRFFTGNTIALAELAGSCREAPTLLFEWLRPLGFTFSQICSMLDAADSSGASFSSTDGSVVAEISHGNMEIVDAARRAGDSRECHTVNLRHDITEPVHIAVSRMPVAAFRPERLGADVAYFDARALDGDAQWELRHWRRGDRMVPFGAHKSKLVSDIFAAAHLSPSQKRSAWLLTRNGEIVWIAGLRNSAHWTVGPETRDFVRLFLAADRTT